MTPEEEKELLHRTKKIESFLSSLNSVDNAASYDIFDQARESFKKWIGIWLTIVVLILGILGIKGWNVISNLPSNNEFIEKLTKSDLFQNDLVSEVSPLIIRESTEKIQNNQSLHDKIVDQLTEKSLASISTQLSNRADFQKSITDAILTKVSEKVILQLRNNSLFNKNITNKISPDIKNHVVIQLLRNVEFQDAIIREISPGVEKKVNSIINEEIAIAQAAYEKEIANLKTHGKKQIASIIQQLNSSTQMGSFNVPEHTDNLIAGYSHYGYFRKGKWRYRFFDNESDTDLAKEPKIGDVVKAKTNVNIRKEYVSLTWHGYVLKHSPIGLIQEGDRIKIIDKKTFGLGAVWIKFDPVN